MSQLNLEEHLRLAVWDPYWQRERKARIPAHMHRANWMRSPSVGRAPKHGHKVLRKRGRGGSQVLVDSTELAWYQQCKVELSRLSLFVLDAPEAKTSDSEVCAAKPHHTKSLGRPKKALRCVAVTLLRLALPPKCRSIYYARIGAALMPECSAVPLPPRDVRIRLR